MYWTIDESPNIQPDLKGEGAKLPGWNHRKGNAFKGEGSAGLEIDAAGDLLKIIDNPTGTVMFGVKRNVVFEFARMGTRIYRYSDFIGPLLITIDTGTRLKLALPRGVFFEHRDRALALFKAYDKENARVVNIRA